MGRIVAIAGGDLSSTRKLNLHTIQLSNKANPHVLFIGTASCDAEGYIEAITKEWTRFYPGQISSMLAAVTPFP